METWRRGVRTTPTPSLGNFLSGMETPLTLYIAHRLVNLGNFLSGMETPKIHVSTVIQRPLETSLVEWKLRTFLPSFAAASPLGNFLSGMETYSSIATAFLNWCLGNFLSGMETDLVYGLFSAWKAPLETSLVEWKPSIWSC